MNTTDYRHIYMMTISILFYKCSNTVMQQYTIEFEYTKSLKAKNVGTPNVFTFTFLRIVITLDVFFIRSQNFAAAKIFENVGPKSAPNRTRHSMLTLARSVGDL